jgi:hypothetical protein
MQCRTKPDIGIGDDEWGRHEACASRQSLPSGFAPTGARLRDDLRPCRFGSYYKHPSRGVASTSDFPRRRTDKNDGGPAEGPQCEKGHPCGKLPTPRQRKMSFFRARASRSFWTVAGVVRGLTVEGDLRPEQVEQPVLSSAGLKRTSPVRPVWGGRRSLRSRTLLGRHSKVCETRLGARSKKQALPSSLVGTAATVWSSFHLISVMSRAEELKAPPQRPFWHYRSGRVVVVPLMGGEGPSKSVQHTCQAGAKAHKIGQRDDTASVLRTGRG